MRVLVTGATGFIGRRLIERLSRQGHELVVLSRSPERAKRALPPQTAVFAWNPIAEVPPAVAFSGVQAVFHLAGEPIAARRWSPAQKKLIRDSRVVGTRHLATALDALGEKRPGVCVAASAIGYYGNRGNEALGEKSSAGRGFMAEVCIEWEKAIAEISHLRVATVRIGVVLGQEGGALQKLIPLYRAGLGGPVGNGEQWMPWIHVEDLVSLLIHAMETEGWEGPFNGVGPSPVQNREFSRSLAHVLHRPNLLKVPAFALKAALGEMSEMLLWSSRVLPQRALAGGFRFQFSELDPALRDLLEKRD